MMSFPKIFLGLGIGHQALFTTYHSLLTTYDLPHHTTTPTPSDFTTASLLNEKKCRP